MRFRAERGLFLLFAAALVACSSSSSPVAADAGGSGQPDGTSLEDAVAPHEGSTEASAAVDGSTDAGLPAVDPSALVSTLSDTELGELCDWQNAELGIYETTVTCRNFKILPVTRAECIQAISYNQYCQLTVEQFENCVLAEAPTQGCDMSGPDCMQQHECYQRDSGM